METDELSNEKKTPIFRLSADGGSVLSHSQFILILKELGFDIRSVGENDTFVLKVNAIKIPKEAYQTFGYYCGGAYAPCSRTNKKEFTIEDIEIAIKKCSQVIMNEIVAISKTPTYFDCRDYLNSFGKSKIDKSSISRVLSILQRNYQELVKSVVGFQHYHSPVSKIDRNQHE